MTGVVTVKDNRRAIKIYIKAGHVVYADGIDKDSQLIKEIATKRKLGQDQIDELKNIREKDPQSFGKTLLNSACYQPQTTEGYGTHGSHSEYLLKYVLHLWPKEPKKMSVVGDKEQNRVDDDQLYNQFYGSTLEFPPGAFEYVKDDNINNQSEK